MTCCRTTVGCYRTPYLNFWWQDICKQEVESRIRESADGAHHSGLAGCNFVGHENSFNSLLIFPRFPFLGLKITWSESFQFGLRTGLSAVTVLNVKTELLLLSSHPPCVWQLDSWLHLKIAHGLVERSPDSFGKFCLIHDFNIFPLKRSLICKGHLSIQGLTNLDLGWGSAFKCIRTPKVWFRKNWNKRVSQVITLSLSILGIHGRCLEALRKWGIDMQKTGSLEGQGPVVVWVKRQLVSQMEKYGPVASWNLPVFLSRLSFLNYHHQKPVCCFWLIFIHIALKCSNQPANVKRYCWSIVWFQLFCGLKTSQITFLDSQFDSMEKCLQEQSLKTFCDRFSALVCVRDREVCGFVQLERYATGRQGCTGCT